jgi:hypothetical protein
MVVSYLMRGSEGEIVNDEIYDDETLWKMYSPKPNPWFSSEIVYEGWGIARFDKPAGTIEGKTKIVVSEAGNLNVEMDYEKLNTEVTIYGHESLKFTKFLQANLSEGNMVGIGTDNINPCSKLIVQTDCGVFESDGKVFYSHGFGFDSKLKFFISDGIYTEQPIDKGKFWVLPLTNFVSTFHLQSHPLVTQHPLRLFRTSMIPEMTNEEQKKKALFAANRANLLITFLFGKSVGFIQPVLDYSEKEEKLKSGIAKKSITALMISDVTNKLEECWFPNDYTNLISAAIGNVVGASWIEFRDETGNLVSRKHIMQLGAEYQNGYAIINEAVHGGLGQLITVASNSQEFGKSYFRVLIAHLIRLQSHSRQIEDHMDLICRTFDTLCEEFGFSTQNLAKSLPEDLRIKISSILSSAQKEVRKISHDSSPDTKSTLQHIESRIANASNTDRAFGLAVTDLLKMYKLPDKSIMDKYYAQFPEPQGKSWVNILTKYRGAAVHTGYFAEEHYDIHDVLVLEDHLQDILVRIALKLVGYEGSYQPRVIQYLVDGKKIDWVNEDTPASQLGYKTPII